MKGRYFEKCPKCGNKICYAKGNEVHCCKCDALVYTHVNREGFEIEDYESFFNESCLRSAKRSAAETIKYWKWSNKITLQTPVIFNKLGEDSYEVVIVSDRPGIIIGKGGETINKLKELLSLIKGIDGLSIKEANFL